jgi:hypothetical protein
LNDSLVLWPAMGRKGFPEDRGRPGGEQGTTSTVQGHLSKTSYKSPGPGAGTAGQAGDRGSVLMVTPLRLESVGSGGNPGEPASRRTPWAPPPC